jgi:hypothetical protein
MTKTHKDTEVIDAREADPVGKGSLSENAWWTYFENPGT